MIDLPARVDVIVVGSGPAGAACAAEIAGHGTVLVLEAGPDYGEFGNDRWPTDLLKACDLAESHGWEYTSEATWEERVVPFSRAQVLGGCSSHNGCAAIWGHRLDYDNWAALGNDGWSTEELLPLFQQVSAAMRVRQPSPAEITPFHRLMLDAAVAIGIPAAADLNDLDDPIGIAASPVNIWNGIRWNAGFAFLDPLRSRTDVSISGDSRVLSVTIEKNRATGVRVVKDGQIHKIACSTVVIAGGTYNSPALLMHSGIGPADDLQSLGIPVVADLPGVGRNLHDHPAIYLQYTGSTALQERAELWAQSNWLPEEQTIAKLRSNQTDEAFDIHIYPESGPYAENNTAWDYTIPVACMTPQARGQLRLRSANPNDAPLIDHNYLGDPNGQDLAVLCDGMHIARDLADAANRDGLLGDEFAPGPEVHSDERIRAWIRTNVHHYFHPAGTCRMGPDSDADAVVNARGHVRGIDGLLVADCSVMPQVPRANTNIPAAVIGMRIGRWLANS
jgi:choline dehydrogenase